MVSIAALATWMWAGAVLAGDFAWPGAFAAEARAAADLIDPARLRAYERLIARDRHRNDPQARALLISLLRDGDVAVRLYAARRLVRAGEPAATEAAIETATRWILTPGVPLVDRTLGLDVLGAAPALPAPALEAVALAVRDADPGLRGMALDVLERRELGAAWPAVLAAVEDDNRDVRLRAVRLVAATRDPRGVLPLVGRLSDADRQVRVEAIRGLGTHAQAIPILLRLAEEPPAPDDLRGTAIEALGLARADAAVPLLSGLARRRPADELARQAQDALARIGTPAAAGALVALARTPPVSADLADALRRAGAAALPALLRELEAGPTTAATVAAAALGEIGDRRATAGLCAVIDQERRLELIPVAIDALARLADPAALATLSRAAEATDLETRRRAYAALLAIGDVRALGVIDRGLADRDPFVRRLAAELAAAIDARAAGPALAGLLRDGDGDVRLAAAAALARLGGPPPGSVDAIVGAILDAIIGAGAPRQRADREWQAIGDALERFVEVGDGPRLTAAFVAARGDGRGPLARALAAIHAVRPLADRGAIDGLITALAAGGATAVAAADTLAVAALPDQARGPLERAFAAAEPAVRARLCSALARLPDGAAALAALLRATDEPVEVRAAAAWAAREVRDELEDELRALVTATGPDAADGPAPDPVAVNARAALAVGGGRRERGSGPPAAADWVGVRLQATDGAPQAGRWLAISAGGGVTVWATTDGAGGARLKGLPPGPLEVRARDARVRPAR